MTDRIAPDATLVAQLRMTALAQAVNAKATKDTDEVVVARAARYLTFLVEGQPAAGDGTGKPEKPATAAPPPPAPTPAPAQTAAPAAPAAAVAAVPAAPAIPPTPAAPAAGGETIPPPVTKEQTIAAVKALMGRNFAGAQEVLGKFGATQLSQIPQAKWAEVVKAANEWQPKEQPKPADAAAALLS